MYSACVKYSACVACSACVMHNAYVRGRYFVIAYLWSQILFDGLLLLNWF